MKTAHHKTPFRKIVGTLVLLGGLTPHASAAEPWTRWAVVSLGSLHADRAAGYNGINPGLGIEIDRADWKLGAGVYHNSLRRTSIYASAGYTPLHVGPVHLGAFAGLATGYNFRWQGKHIDPAPMAGLLATWRGARYGINIIAVPPVPRIKGCGFIGLQALATF
jgi:hypothetical protein